MENEYSIVGTLYRFRTGRRLHPGEEKLLAQWLQDDPANQVLFVRINSHPKPNPALYAEIRDRTENNLTRLVLPLLFIITIGFFCATIYLLMAIHR